MIVGIGIDAVEIERFATWHTYNHKTLSRIFSPQEIEYCLASPIKSAERFAVRFSAREAFFKAWNMAFADQYIPLLTQCKAISIDHGPHHTPYLKVDWAQLGMQKQQFSALMTLTHSNNTAIVCVMIQKISM